MSEKEELKLETVNMGDVEIFETGVWKGNKYTERDIDDFVENFNNGVAEPYITIDHSAAATGQFQDALKSLALGFVEKLERKGNKMHAWFKQVPKTIADLVQAGALKKKSIEFRRQLVSNGQLHKNVLQGVTFHGANGLPEVNTLSDFLNLYKSNLQVMDKKKEGVVSLDNKDFMKEERQMDKIELKQDEYNELLKAQSRVETTQEQNEILTKQVSTFKADIETLRSDVETFKKRIESSEKLETENLKKEADSYVSGKINDGVIAPAHKDRYVSEYITYKADEDNFKDWKEDIEGRNKIINLGAVNHARGDLQENFKYDPEKLNFQVGSTINYDEAEKHIQARMELKSETWEQASIALGFTNPNELGDQPLGVEG